MSPSAVTQPLIEPNSELQAELEIISFKYNLSRDYKSMLPVLYRDLRAKNC